jgi:hypothetical protein
MNSFFSIWDIYRNSIDVPSYSFSSDYVWNGLREQEKVLCNGLISDWAGWQNDLILYKLAESTILRLNLNESDCCIMRRDRFDWYIDALSKYKSPTDAEDHLRSESPFVWYEVKRQGYL